MAARRGTRPETDQKRQQIVELRRSGLSWREIGNVIGLDPKGVRQHYLTAISTALQDAGAEELRAEEGDRLDRLQRAAWAKALAGDLPAIHTVLRIMERRAKLFGLDAPVKVAATVEHLDVASIDQEVARLVTLLTAVPAESREVGGGQNEISFGDDESGDDLAGDEVEIV